MLICDTLNLPYRDESFDAALSIAVIHHLATRDRRVRALRELARILRVGGRILITVWAKEQRHRKVSTENNTGGALARTLAALVFFAQTRIHLFTQRQLSLLIIYTGEQYCHAHWSDKRDIYTFHAYTQLNGGAGKTKRKERHSFVSG